MGFRLVEAGLRERQFLVGNNLERIEWSATFVQSTIEDRRAMLCALLSGAGKTPTDAIISDFMALADEQERPRNGHTMIKNQAPINGHTSTEDSSNSALALSVLGPSMTDLTLDEQTVIPVSLGDLLQFKERIEAQMHIPDPAELQLQMKEAAVIFSNHGLEVIENNLPIADGELTPLSMAITIRKGVMGPDFDAQISDWQTPGGALSADPVVVFGARTLTESVLPTVSDPILTQMDETAFQFAKAIRLPAQHPRMNDGQMMSVMKKLQLSEEDSPQKIIAKIAAAIMFVLGKKAPVRDVRDVLSHALGVPHRNRMLGVLAGQKEWAVIEPASDYVFETPIPVPTPSLKKRGRPPAVKKSDVAEAAPVSGADDRSHALQPIDIQVSRIRKRRKKQLVTTEKVVESDDAVPALQVVILDIVAQLAETLKRSVTVADLRQHAIREIEDTKLCDAIMTLLSLQQGATSVSETMLHSLFSGTDDSLPPAEVHPETAESAFVIVAEDEDDSVAEKGNETPQTLRDVVLRIVNELSAITDGAPTVQDLRVYFDMEENDGPAKRALLPLFARVHGGKIITPDMLASTFPSNGKPSPLDMSFADVQAKYGTVQKRNSAYRKSGPYRVQDDVRTISRLRESPRKKHALKPDSDDLEPAMPDLSDPDAIPAYLEFGSIGLGATIELEIGRMLHRVLQLGRGVTSMDIHKICRSICAVHADRRTVASVIDAINARDTAIAELHEHFGKLEDTAGVTFQEDIDVAVRTNGDRYTGPINSSIKFNEDPRFANRAGILDNQSTRHRLLKGKMPQREGAVHEDDLGPEADADRYMRQHTSLTSYEDLVNGKFSADFGDDEVEEAPTDEQLAATEEGTESSALGPAEDFARLGIDPYKSTSAKPGSEAKVSMLQARHEAGLPFWRDDDNHGQGSPLDKDVEGEYMSWEERSVV